MKKIICCILLIIMIFSIAACDFGDSIGKELGNITGNGSGASQGNNTPKEESFGLMETAVFKTLKFTATEIKESYGTTFFEPSSGKVFVGIKFTIQNISDEDQVISSLLLFEAYADDVKCSESFTAAAAFGSEMLDGTIAPGKKMVGWYALEVPENWTSIELHVQSNILSGNSAKFIFTN